MLFDDSSGFRWKPHYIQVVRRYWLGESKIDISTDLGISQGHVTKIVECDKALQVLAQLENNTLDTMYEVQAAAQAVALEAIQVKIDLLRSGNETVRSKASTDLLALAGHTPMHKVEITKVDALEDKYQGKTELDLRKELLNMLNKDQTPIAPPSDKAPDGGLLN